MKITAEEILGYGIIDGIIPEGKKCFSAINKMLTAELNRLCKLKKSVLVAERYKKFRNIDGINIRVNMK